MSNTPSTRKDEFLFHPYNVMLFLSLFGVTALFLSLTLAYVYTRVAMQVPAVQIPALFWLNTLILLCSSYTMILAKKAYLNDDTGGYQRFLRVTIWLSCLFLVMQVAAWWWLFRNNVDLRTSNTAAYLYLLSFVHLMHVVAGLPFLILFYRTARKRMVDPVTVLVYFSDPEKRLKLRLLTIYWHFLDILWVYLVLFLGVNYWI